MAIRIEGTNKTFGVHAAGVVISADPLDEIVPLQRNNDGSVITQYSMEELESLGLLKMDFLGLRNLTIIQKTLDYIKQTHNNLQLDPYALPADERKAMQILAEGRVKKLPGDIDTTYKLLERGDLEGVFQLESSGMRQIVQELKPSCIEDISSILALYRPGPLDAGLIPKFIARKHGEKIQYEHSLLQPILEETYGILVYQEQIMKMAQDLAGYSLGQADLLRRAMGKKKPEEMNKQRELFIDGSTKNGVPQKVAEQLFEQMVLFAEYCFNKSHSTAYAYVTYQTAYLKANYPAEYMAALLTANSGDQDKVKKYIANCGGLEIEVEPPDINRSQVDFTIENGKILFGLSAVKNLGQGAIEHILVARDKDGPFKSLPDLCDRVDLRAVNSRALESLIKCGALDKINRNRHQLIAHLELSMKWAAERAKEQDSGQLNLFNIGNNTQSQTAAASFDTAPKNPDVKDYPVQEKLQFEKELLGFYLSNHPLKDVAKLAQQEGITLTPNSLAHLEDQRAKSKVTVIVIITDIKGITTKKGDQMAILQIEDLEGKAEAVVFPKTYTDVKASIATDVPIIIKGKVDKRDEQQAQILVEELTPISVQSNSEPQEDGRKPNYEPQEDGLKPNYEPRGDIGRKPNYEPKTDKWLLLQLTPEQVLSVPHQEQLRSILQEYSGGTTGQKVPVVVLLIAHNQHKAIRLAPSFWVEDLSLVVSRLNNAGFKAFDVQKPV